MAKLEKAVFKILDTKAAKNNSNYDGKDHLEVLFNPKELQLDRSLSYAPASNNGEPAPALMSKGQDNFMLSMTLYFDTFEKGTSVRKEYMVKLEQLTKPPESDAAPASGGTDPETGEELPPKPVDVPPPPTVLFVWGQFRFCGQITSLSQKYTMFLSDGTPVRAEASITLFQTIITDKDVSFEKGTLAVPDNARVAQEGLEQGAAAFAGGEFDDPLDHIRNSADAAGLSTAAQAGKGGMVSGIAGAAVGAGAIAALSHNMQGMVPGAIAGMATGGAFGNGNLGDTLGKLATGQSVGVLSAALGGEKGAFASGLGGLAGFHLNPNGSLGADFNAGGGVKAGNTTYGTLLTKTINADGTSGSSRTTGPDAEPGRS